MELDNMKLSDILEAYEHIENPSEHDKEQKKSLENMIAEYGNITLGEYKTIKVNETTYSSGTPRYIIESERAMILNHKPSYNGIETASFEDMMCDAGLW